MLLLMVLLGEMNDVELQRLAMVPDDDLLREVGHRRTRTYS